MTPRSADMVVTKDRRFEFIFVSLCLRYLKLNRGGFWVRNVFVNKENWVPFRAWGLFFLDSRLRGNDKKGRLGMTKKKGVVDPGFRQEAKGGSQDARGNIKLGVLGVLVVW